MYLKYLFFILIIFISTNCCRQNDLNLNQSTTAWMPYKATKELFFTNETGDTIIFTFANRHYNQQATDKVCGAYNIETQETVLKMETDTAFQVHIVASHEAVLSIKVFNRQVPGNNLLVQFNCISGQFISDPWRDRYEEEQNVNGNIYPQVLHVYGNQIGGVLSFADLLYARNDGLIGFKLFDGGWYFLTQ